jgi:hypothetical protein
VVARVIQIGTDKARLELGRKIKECLRTKVVYVKSISDKRLAALNAKGFTVILK